MPLYEFRCTDCGRSFELLLPYGASEPPCPGCGSASVRRLISVIAGLGGTGSAPSGGCGCGGACTCRR